MKRSSGETRVRGMQTAYVVGGEQHTGQRCNVNMTIGEMLQSLQQYPADYEFIFTVGEDDQRYLKFESGYAKITGPFQFDCNDEAKVVYVGE